MTKHLLTAVILPLCLFVICISCKKEISEASISTSVASRGVTQYPIQLDGFRQLSLDRKYVSAVGGGGRIFFAGGAHPFGAPFTTYTRVDIFNATTLAHSTAELSQARFGMGTAVVGNKVFFAGGFTSYEIPTDRIDIYDLVSSTWSTASLSEARGAVAVAAAGNKIIFAGGLKADLYWSNVIDIYNNDLNTWTKSSFGSNILPSAASAGSTIAIAGYNAAGNANARIYNVTSNTWTSVALSPPGSTHYVTMPAAGAQKKILFRLGAYDPLSPIFNIITTGTNQVGSASLRSMRAGSRACSSLNYAFFAGGRTQNFTVDSDLIDIYNVQLDKWYLKKLAVPMGEPACGAFGNKLMFAGENKLIQIYNITGESPN